MKDLMGAVYQTRLFPPCFATAHDKLRSKFKYVDSATIQDSIQYAQTEYWMKHIDQQIQNDQEALGWIISTARHYLYKEIKRTNRICDISEASSISSGIDIERQYIYREELELLEQDVAKRWNPTIVQHAMGYSLQELADSANISLSSVQQRHARERMLARKKLRGIIH